MNKEFCINGCRSWTFSENKIVLEGYSLHKETLKEKLKVYLADESGDSQETKYTLRFRDEGERYFINVIIHFQDLPKPQDEIHIYYNDEKVYDVAGITAINLISQVCYDIIDIGYEGKYLQIKGWISGGSVVILGVRYAGSNYSKKIKMEHTSFDAQEYHSNILEAIEGNNGFILKVKKPKYPVNMILTSDKKTSEKLISI